MKKMNIVIDTDIGTDNDDAFALAYLLKYPKANVKAITTVIGDTVIRAKIARKLERLLNREIPIIAGCKGKQEIIKKYWCGFEQEALTPEELKEPLEKMPFPEYDENTVLVCTAPLTNIAYQLIHNPSIRRVKTLYVMGSSLDDHNLKVDKQATRLVFQEPWTIYQTRKEDSKKVSFSRDELKQFKGSELGDFLYESAVRWLDYSKKEKSAMYDVLTVSSVLGEEYVQFNKWADNRFISNHVNNNLKDKIIEIIRSAK